MSISILTLTKYGRLGASSRMRFLQYFPFLENEGFELIHKPLITDKMLALRYQVGKYSFLATLSSYVERIKILLTSHQYDLVWIQAEALPYFPVWLERWLLNKTPYVLEYDDAIFHNYDQHRLGLVRWIFGRRLDKLMKGSNLVVAGNAYLAERAVKAGAKRVEIIPTVVDLERYSPSKFQDIPKPRIVWIGTKSTVKYLINILPVLHDIYRHSPFVLRVIGATIEDDVLEVENIPWSESTEVDSIAGADIGIMPLTDSLWERGKCGYKLIQYMACGLPVVGSAVGVNVEIIENSQSGFVAKDDEDWKTSLLTLLGDVSLRNVLGAKGRIAVETVYSLQAQQSRVLRNFENLLLKDQ